MTKNPKSLEERIADALRESYESGEIRRARSWGKPLDLGDGYDETPADLRMGYKVLKDAGAFPIEVEIMREIRALESRLAALDAKSLEAAELRRKVADLRLDVSLRMEALAKRSRG